MKPGILLFPFSLLTPFCIELVNASAAIALTYCRFSVCRRPVPFTVHISFCPLPATGWRIRGVYLLLEY
jgi:hypothetical protein